MPMMAIMPLMLLIIGHIVTHDLPFFRSTTAPVSRFMIYLSVPYDLLVPYDLPPLWAVLLSFNSGILPSMRIAQQKGPHETYWIHFVPGFRVYKLIGNPLGSSRKGLQLYWLRFFAATP
eukprot:4227821-Amphidinium_carterae.1